MTISWERYLIEDYPGNLWSDWDSLNQDYNQGHPMLQSTFVSKLIEYFPPKRNLEVLVAYCGESIVALGLLESPGLGIATMYKPSQVQIALLLIPPAKMASIDDMAKPLPAKTVRLDVFNLDPKYQGLPVNDADNELQRSAINMVIKVEKDFSSYWGGRPKKLRKNISRYIGRLRRERGEYTFHVISNTFEIRSAVARYGFMESCGWKGRTRTALHPGNVQGNFYRDVMEEFSRIDNAKIFEIHVQGKLVASRLCIHNSDQLIALKTTYDEDYRKYSVGRILLYETIKYLFEQAFSSTIDFYTDASKDQLEWATQSRPMYNMSIYPGYLGFFVSTLTKLRHLIVKKERAGS